MFRWYKDAVLCFAYLEDLPIGRAAASKDELERCRWFTRGWTLQELIAPKEVRFYDRGWNYRGSKKSLQDAISRVTAIDKDVMLGRSRLGSIPVAERMSWASRRQTTRQEDMAYCLLGIFGVNMALIYGEGVKAFTRLQEEIIKRTNDISILAWDSRGGSSGPYCGVLAESPAKFAQVPRNLSAISGFSMTEFVVTNSGLRMTAELWVPSNPTSFDHGHDGYYLCLSDALFSPSVGIHLKKVGRSHFVRISDKPLTASYLESKDIDWEESMRLQTIYIAISYSPEDGLGTLAGWIPFYFPAHPVFTVSGVAPRAGWDALNHLFYTGGAGFSSFFGVVRIDVSDIGDGGKEPVKLGVIVHNTDDSSCSIVKWEGTAQQQMELAFENDSDVILPEAFIRALHVMSRSSSVDFHIKSEHFRISVSTQREVVKEISPSLVKSVHIRRLKRSTDGEGWVSLD